MQTPTRWFAAPAGRAFCLPSHPPGGPILLGHAAGSALLNLAPSSGIHA
ncbi:hypothetical protein [Dictyobacter formicarum]|nr:hypothetical protein [Dictyobacter formicarum]